MPACIYVHHVHDVPEVEGRSSETGLTGHVGAGKQTGSQLGPLQEQQLLTAKPSLQTLNFTDFYLITVLGIEPRELHMPGKHYRQPASPDPFLLFNLEIEFHHVSQPGLVL